MIQVNSAFRVFRAFAQSFGTTLNNLIINRSATTKSGGSTRNGRDSIGKRLGLKKTFRSEVKIGNIIVRQRGKTYLPGVGVGLGRDYTLFALTEGYVTFTHDKFRKQTVVHVVPEMPIGEPKIRKRESRRIEEDNVAKVDPKLAAIIQDQRENMEMLALRKAIVPRPGVRDMPPEAVKEMEDELEMEIMWELRPSEMMEMVENHLRRP